MPYKHSKDKKRWRERYREKQARSRKDWEERFRNRPEEKAKREAAKARAKTREKALFIKELKSAIKEVRSRIMMRDKLAWCYLCNTVKPEAEVYIRGKSKSINGECRVCQRMQVRKWGKKNPEKIRAYRRKHRAKHIEKAREYARAYYYKKKKDPEKNIKIKLLDRVRRKIKKCAKGIAVTSTLENHIGCTWPELIDYLESRFEKGMTWENHGINTWHIDHIYPISRFDFTDIQQVKLALHYTNLKPMWAKDNIRKSNDVPLCYQFNML